MKFQFEVNDVVTLVGIENASADELGVSERKREFLLASQQNADEWIVSSVNSPDGFDVELKLSISPSLVIGLYNDYLIPTPETLNGLLGEYGLDM